ALLFIADDQSLGLADCRLLEAAGGKLLCAATGAGEIKGPEIGGDTWPLTAAAMGCGLTVCPVLGKATKGAASRSVIGPATRAVLGLPVEPGRLASAAPPGYPFGKCARQWMVCQYSLSNTFAEGIRFTRSCTTSSSFFIRSILRPWPATARPSLPVGRRMIRLMLDCCRRWSACTITDCALGTPTIP